MNIKAAASNHMQSKNKMILTKIFLQYMGKYHNIHCIRKRVNLSHDQYYSLK